VRDIMVQFTKTAQRPNRQKGRWTFHCYGLEDNQANQLAIKLEKILLAQVKQHLPKLWRRYVDPATMAKGQTQPGDFVVQLFCQNSSMSWLSTGSFAAGISPYIAGNLRMRARPEAPSRSSRKLEEAFRVLGQKPVPGETAVDLGAAPGGWTYGLARQGARVTAVDGTDLKLPDTKTFRENVQHVRENGLLYLPSTSVDWLCCDMVVSPYETLRVLKNWLDKQLMQHFIINLKLPRSEPWKPIGEAIDLMSRHPWHTFKARHLFHDRFEITLMGSRMKPQGKNIAQKTGSSYLS
jgi:23S rRNA C2498 (ribose-2'-O)-methylase RlmM